MRPPTAWSGGFFLAARRRSTAVSTEVCHIGRPVAVDGKHVRLQEMSPDAVLYDEPEEYDLREITRIDFGGGYEDALWLVGGDN